MNITNKKLFIIALIFGVAATLSVYYYLSKVEESMKQTEPVKQVVTAKITINQGTIINKDMIELKELKDGSIPPSSFYSLDDVVGRIAKEKIYKGETVIHDRIADDIYKQKHLAYSIPKGYRAITLQYNPVMGVSGFIQPGDYVDIIGTYVQENSPNDSNISKIILQKVLVLAIGPNPDIKVERDLKDINTITLAVKPGEAEKITYTEELASIKLLLRPLNEQALPSTTGITKDNIITP